MIKDKRNILLCSDLDGTILPTSNKEESIHARPLLSALVNYDNFFLAYVSGRSKKLIKDAIDKYYIPEPHYAITDVGATIYEIINGKWIEWSSWDRELAKDWGEFDRSIISDHLKKFSELKLQEDEKQGKYKISYYLELNENTANMLGEIKRLFEENDLSANMIWSIDEKKNIGLLDLLPKRANKFHAIAFLMNKKGFKKKRTVFSGDSGNDMQALTSTLQAVLVRNATDDVRIEAEKLVKEGGREKSLYVAQGNFLGMNGYYSAGVLEGLVHYIPEVYTWLTENRKKF